MPSKSGNRRGGRSRDHAGSEPGTSPNVSLGNRSPRRRGVQPQEQLRFTSPKNRTRQNEQGSAGAAGSTNRGQQSSTNILLKMSDACSKHSDYHSKKQPDCRPDPNNDENYFFGIL